MKEATLMDDFDRELLIERRRLKRIELDLPIQIDYAAETGESRVSSRTENISADGALIRHRSHLPVGTIVSVELTLPFSRFCRTETGSAQADCCIHVSAFLAELRPNGTVLRFIDNALIFENGSAPILH